MNTNETKSSPEAGSPELPPAPDAKFTRRDFTKIVTIAAGGAAVAATGITMSMLSGTPGADDPTGPDTIRNIPDLPTVPKGEGGRDEVRLAAAMCGRVRRPGGQNFQFKSSCRSW